MVWSTRKLEPSELAKSIARDIFSAGDEPNDKAQRIAFKGGKWPDNETNLGGFCELALAARIDTSLREHLPMETS